MLPVDTVSTMDEILDSTVSPRRFSAILISIFAALALLLAAIGVYGVMSYMTGRRTGEMGIRMALGAQPRDVVRMILGEGILLATIGIVVGTAGAIALTRFLASMLFEIKPTDPATFVGVAMLLLIVSLAACYIPARRAMRVDPVTALKCE
jgi:putative ABC transport system permease protein